MRKQYHFRPSKNGFYAWDVDKLVALSKALPIISIKLEDIKELDENYWYNDYGKDIPTCRSISEHCKLINETNLKFPIILSKNGKIMDGMHRVCKAFIMGLQEINAVQFTVDPKPDYKNVYAEDLQYD
ncbi:MAG: hypothetical protein ABFR05_09840 [Bacteroidota bacterium]